MKKSISAVVAASVLALSAVSAVPANAQSNISITYPAPEVTPNTTNGVVPETTNPTPAPVNQEKLANTGPDASLLVWGSVGLLAIIAGIVSVVRARRDA